MLKTISLIVLLLVTSGVSAEECTRDWIGICKEDKGVFYVTEVLLLLDAMQTHDIPRHPGHYESNRYLGPYPSNHRINTGTIIVAIHDKLFFSSEDKTVRTCLRYCLISFTIKIKYINTCR